MIDVGEDTPAYETKVGCGFLLFELFLLSVIVGSIVTLFQSCTYSVPRDNNQKYPVLEQKR